MSYRPSALPEVDFHSRDRMYYVFFFIHVATRRVLHVAVTLYIPILRQCRELMHPDQIPLKYLIIDNDGSYTGLDQKIESLGLKAIRNPPRHPWMNPYAERWVRTAREGCTDRIIAISDRHLLSQMQKFIKYYNTFRPHSGIHSATPLGRERRMKTSDNSRLVSFSHCGGLHCHYELLDVA